MSVKLFGLSVILCAVAILSSCDREQTQMYKTYQVHRLAEPMVIDGDWDKPQWQKVQPLDIRLFMGDEPEHQPRTRAKALYDEENIYVIFRVEDRYVRAVEKGFHSSVCLDSCVEFFFTPGSEIKLGYFNVETNCGGTILFHYQTARNQNLKALDISDCKRVEIAHSLPKFIDPERTEPVTWTLEYRLPIEILEKYSPIIRPKPGVKWRANFYKCADRTSHPHWLTWSLVENDRPNFHLPEYFGTLKFVD
jgi:hypothetical protein